MAFLRKYGRPNVKMDRVEAEDWEKKVAVNTQRSHGKNDLIAWLQRAANDDNHAAAQYVLGVCYHDGIGVEKSPEIAVSYYKMSAAGGNARGQGILGFCYGEGFGVEKDQNKALELYLSAAKKGETVSMYNVAHCYEEGIGATKNLAEVNS